MTTTGSSMRAVVAPGLSPESNAIQPVSGRRANVPRKRTTRPTAACRAIGVTKATDCSVPAPIR